MDADGIPLYTYWQKALFLDSVPNSSTRITFPRIGLLFFRGNTCQMDGILIDSPKTPPSVDEQAAFCCMSVANEFPPKFLLEKILFPGGEIWLT